MTIIEPMLAVQLNPNKTKHFVIVGAGGTGGHLLPNLARIVSLQNEKLINEREAPSTITIIDADDVEEKNLIRQNFVASDISKNKAMVLANRYGRAFNLPIRYLDEYIQSKERFTEILMDIIGKEKIRTDVIVIDCVDNTKTRHFLYHGLKGLNEKIPSKRLKTYFLSSGNEERAGQVIFTPIDKKDDLQSFFDSEEGKGEGTFVNKTILSQIQSGTLIESKVMWNLPSPFEIFPESMRPKDKLPTEQSCAENAISAPQNISANLMASNILFNYLNKLVTGERVSEMCIFFSAKNNSMKTYYMKESQLKELMTIEDKKNPFLLSFLTKQDEDCYAYDELRFTKEEVEEMRVREKELREESFNAKTIPHN